MTNKEIATSLGGGTGNNTRLHPESDGKAECLEQNDGGDACQERGPDLGRSHNRPPPLHL